MHNPVTGCNVPVIVKTRKMFGRAQRMFQRLLLLPVVAAVMLAPGARPADAQAVQQQKISPTLQNLMTANPLQVLPVIVQMQEASAPFTSGTNTKLAQQALTILQANGQAVGP